MELNLMWHIRRWIEIRRYKKEHSMSYRPEGYENIELTLSKAQIEKYIKKNNYIIGYLDLDDIKAKIYYKIVENTKNGIEAYLYEQHRNHQEQFECMFWEEYVFKYDSLWNYKETHKQWLDKQNKLWNIYYFLEANKKYQGATGEDFQETDLGDKIEKLTGMSFGWRGWGGLMSAYMNSKCKKRKYHYMSFYM